MGDTTTIEWTDRTWNPVTGCTQISAGCDNCYAKTIAERFRGHAAFPHGFDVQLRAHKVNDPLSWKKPAKVFVNSMSDLFHNEIDQAWIADIFAVIAASRRHTFQLLTKRHARMRTLLNDSHFVDQVRSRAIGKGLEPSAWAWPLPNLWLGVSVENQQWADIRIPALLRTPAAIRWISAEPLLGPVDLKQAVRTMGSEHGHGLDWVVAGGESGRGARPMSPTWATSLRDQCAQADVPFLFKQWGEYAPTGYLVIGGTSKGTLLVGDPVDDIGHRVEIARVGKKAAGRELDGRLHDDYPAMR
ncbi:phage Gp37/Gp68 family protein [Streptomyces sp. NPDC006551]|uniref:DUF5131 family protein n=1 Tax=Streptomyces sp. NPDC006551 TaxID=3157178 RepID=UPI0033ADA311